MEQEKSKIKEVINKIFNTPLICIIIGFMIFAKTIVFYKSTIAINIPTVIGTFYFIAAGVCFISILPNRLRAWISFIIDILFSILLFSDNLYYIYSNSFLSIAQIGNLRYTREILSTIPELLRAIQIFYFIDIILIIILKFATKTKIEKAKKCTKEQIIVKIAIIIIAIGLSVFVAKSYVSKGYDFLYNKDEQMRAATIFGYHIYDFENGFNKKKRTKFKTYDEMKQEYDKLKQSYNEQYGEHTYNLEGTLKEKNIIILQLESVQDFVVNKTINGKEITPNLNKFLRENIRFTNMYMQSYSTTADSEYSVMTSLYPAENGVAFSQYYTNTYDDIFKIFNNANYFTSFMHGNYAYFWNRGNVYKRLNLDDLSLEEQFEDRSEIISSYLSDELLYKQAIQKTQKFDSPFISFISSASSHTPFTLEGLQDTSKADLDVGEYTDTWFGNYLRAVNYADYTFGLFIDELEKTGLYENTAIFVFGDHNGLSMDDENLIEFLTDIYGQRSNVDLALNYAKVLGGARIPGVEKIQIDKPISKLDIKPTLAYLCGIEDGISLGTNIFESKDFVCLNNERIITDRYYYDGIWYDIPTGVEIQMDKLDEETKNLLNKYIEFMKEELDISNSIMINNLLK